VIVSPAAHCSTEDAEKSSPGAQFPNGPQTFHRRSPTFPPTNPDFFILLCLIRISDAEWNSVVVDYPKPFGQIWQLLQDLQLPDANQSKTSGS
jgi:hypothetical protein